MLAFGVMSEKRLAIFAVSALGIVAVVLVGFWLVLASGMWASGPFLGNKWEPP